MRWQRNYYDESRWRYWDEEKYIIFNVGSAQTHHLNQFAVDILTLLKDQPLAFPEFIEQFIELYGSTEIDDQTINYLKNTLVLLDGVGLIQPEMM